MVFLNIHVGKSFGQNLWKMPVKEFILSQVANPTNDKFAKNELLHRYFSKTDQRFQNTYLTGHLWVNVSDFDHTLLDLKLSWFIILFK